MKRKEIVAISTERVGRWVAKAVTRHHTPILMVSCGHDHAAGDVLISTCDDVTDEQLIHMLRGVLARLEAGNAFPVGDKVRQFPGEEGGKPRV